MSEIHNWVPNKLQFDWIVSYCIWHNSREFKQEPSLFTQNHTLYLGTGLQSTFFYLQQDADETWPIGKNKNQGCDNLFADNTSTRICIFSICAAFCFQLFRLYQRRFLQHSPKRKKARPPRQPLQSARQVRYSRPPARQPKKREFARQPPRSISFLYCALRAQTFLVLCQLIVILVILASDVFTLPLANIWAKEGPVKSPLI